MSWWAARISKHLTAKHRREEEVYLLIAYNDCILYFNRILVLFEVSVS